MPSYGSTRVGGVAYGGSKIALPGSSGSGISIPGSTAVFYWVTSGGAAAYGQAAYGGARAVVLPSAGISAVPDGAAGLVTLALWWAYSNAVNIARVRTDTGESTDVRTANPLPTGGTSYHNGSLNPKAANDTAGATAGSNTTLSRLTGLVPAPSPYVTTAFRGKATSAGAVTLAFTGEPVVAQTPYSFGFWARTSSTATAIQLSVTWFDKLGTNLGSVSYATNSTARTQALNAWSWCEIDVTSWPADAVVGSLSYQATGMSTNGTFDVTGRITAPTPDYQGTYFDGDYPGASWNGVPGESPSDLAPMFYTTDGEAPFDVPFFYEMTNPNIPGYTAQTQTVELSSDGRNPPYDSLLTHPGLPATIPVWVEAEPDIVNTIAQGIFKVLGRSNPVVISDPQRAGDSGTMVIVAENFDERNRLYELLSDGSPLLLRSPASYGHPGEWWLSFSDITTSPQYISTLYGRSAVAPTQMRRITANFQQVDRPSAATSPI